MEFIKVKNLVLKKVGQNIDSKNQVDALSLWVEFAKTFKLKDYNKLYKNYQFALERLTEEGMLKYNDSLMYMKNDVIILTSKGMEYLSILNRNVFRRIYCYFESQIKDEMFKILVYVTGLVIAYILGRIKTF